MGVGVGAQNRTSADVSSIVEEIKYLKSRLETLEKSLEVESTPEKIFEWYKKEANKIEFVDVLE